jgi:uncharacterized membrane protein YfcA
MTIITLTLVIFAGSYFAGLIGSMTGLGGGFIVIPLLTLILHVDIHYAIGASLLSVIATSSGAGAAYVKEGIINLRLAMFLEIATTAGATAGALFSVYVPTRIIPVLIGIILIFSSIMSLRKKEELHCRDFSKFSERLKLNGTYEVNGQSKDYSIINVAGGFFSMLFAGVLSGLLGIGSGALKVFAMDTIMRVPFKVSTTTSNFMIGVTAAASAVIYFQRGFIDPVISMPVAVGVIFGSLSGAKLLHRINSPKILRLIFSVVVGVLALQMIYKAIQGGN